MSLVGGNRGQQGLIKNNSPNNKLADSGDTGPMIEGGIEICGSAVAGGASFCLSYMDERSIASHTW